MCKYCVTCTLQSKKYSIYLKCNGVEVEMQVFTLSTALVLKMLPFVKAETLVLITLTY